MPGPTVAALQVPNRVELLRVLQHNQVPQFAREFYWQKKTWLTWAHQLFSVGVLGVWVLIGITNHLSFDAWMTNFGLAVLAAMVVLLPIHEWIHGAVYRACGARDVRYKLEWRHFYAYAIAHQFVAGRRHFSWVAVTPFLIINLALMLASIWLVPHQFFLLAVLLIHTAGTSGDFAMLNFLWLNRREEVYTFDDAEEKVSYFYKRIEPTK